MQRIELTPFVTEENGTRRMRAVRTRRPRRRPRGRGASGRKREARATAGARFMLVKLGICAAACLAVFGMRALDLPLTNDMVEEVRAAVNTQMDLDEMLGKLQFVELPGVLEVFGASEGKLALPVSACAVTVLGNDQLARWESEPNAQVLASAAGEVRAVGEDPVLGRYVRLTHENDLETIYYGLAVVNVEEGQPVRRLDTLGLLGEDGTLCLSVLLSGRPQQPQDYFDVVLNT